MSSFEIYSSPGNNSKRSRLSPNRTINQASPIRQDIHFYVRKVGRLQEDIMCMGDQLNKARLRLRRAEDYEYKYEALMKQKVTWEGELANKDRRIGELVEENQRLKMKLNERGDKSNENLYEKERLLKDIEVWKQKVLEAEQRANLAVAEQQRKAHECLQRELSVIRKRYSETEEQLKFQIARLTKQVEDRQKIDGNTLSRQDKQAKQKEREILRLEDLITKMREDYRMMVDEKNEEIMRVKDKFQGLMNIQLSSLHKNMNSQDQKFKIELEGLRAIIEIKNQDISNLQKQLKIDLEDHSKTRQQLNQEIQLLKSKLYERQRQSQEELFNMKERLTSLHGADIEAMKQHYEELVQNLKEDRRELDKLMGEKDKTIDYQRKQIQRGKDELKKILADRDRQIAQLKHLLAATGQSSTSEIETLQQALSKYADEKQTLSNEYQSNLSFLNQQISKLTASNDLKNNQIKELHQYVAMLKKDHFESIKELETKWKQERKDREQEREKERDLRESVEEQFREKEKLWKNKERQLEMQCEKQKREKSKWAVGHEKLQKEIERLYGELSLLEDSCRNQFNKNQTTVITGGGSKRQLVGQLQRQKGQFQALKRMEIDQVKKKYQLELIRLSNANQKLQKQLSAKKIDYEKLEEEFRKISSQYRNIEKINKDKLAIYQKQMNTINSEILLTQNLYQSLLGAKSKVAKKV